jgi:hypothetical protein
VYPILHEGSRLNYKLPKVVLLANDIRPFRPNQTIQGDGDY